MTGEVYHVSGETYHVTGDTYHVTRETYYVTDKALRNTCVLLPRRRRNLDPITMSGGSPFLGLTLEVCFGVLCSEVKVKVIFPQLTAGFSEKP